MKKINSGKILIGWKEWCGLPEIGIPLIKAKVDTGAQTSALHAFNLKNYKKNRKDFIAFSINPLQGNKKLTVEVNMPVYDYRTIVSSNGQKEKRFVILTKLHLAERIFEIEITLTNRSLMQYRMLLGRQALIGNVIIDPHQKFNLGSYKVSDLKKLYKI